MKAIYIVTDNNNKVILRTVNHTLAYRYANKKGFILHIKKVVLA